jgi:isopentenyl diphosphate isomerase/L-lactate dehydrogenase-like FMN-dependent dehydrogenase
LKVKNEPSEIFDIDGDFSQAITFDPENVFDPAKREASPFSMFNENTLSPEFVQNILSQITDPASLYQFTYYLEGNLNKPQEFPVAVERLEHLAEQKLGKYLWSYVGSKGVAGNGETYWQNLLAFKRYFLLPNIATGAASKPFTFAHQVSFGKFMLQVPSPIFVAPIGAQTIIAAGGELQTVQAATSANVSFMYSSQSTFSPEVVAATAPQGDLFFQLYATSVPQLNQSLIQRAFEAGYKAIILTLDTTKYAVRERELEFGFLPFTWKARNEPGDKIHGLGLYFTDVVFNTIQSQQFGSVADPIFINLPGGPYPVDINQAIALASVVVNSSASVIWDERFPGDPFAIDWFVNEVTTKRNLPLILKGILKEDDARRAVQKGASGVYVSNHGGRQIFGAVPAIDVLSPIAQAVKDEAIKQNVPKPAILFDSGIRRGAEVVKAYALGAEWVGIGRPVLYGLGAGGKAGAQHALQTILADLENTTQNMGYTDISQVKISDIRSAIY